MGRSRRARRRDARARARRPSSTRRISAPARAGLLVGGALCVIVGIMLVAAGGPTTAARLGRVAGILVALGLAGCVVGALGRL